jgi:hypothetical protein
MTPRAPIAACLPLVAALACGGEAADDREPPGADGAAAARDSDAAPAVDGAGGAHKVVFATSSEHTGDLGGVAGADDVCAERAADAGLPGTFRAWLSAPDQSAAERLAHADIAYARTDGVRVADDWDDLVDGELAAAIDRDETGAQVGGDAWTGTLASGAVADASCGGFASEDDVGLCGSTGETGAGWTDNIRPPCSSTLRLYCVEQ